MFGFFKRKKLTRTEEAMKALVSSAERIRAIKWDTNDISAHFALQREVAAITIGWKTAFAEIPVEPEGVFASIINGYPGTDGYSEEDRIYLFDQLQKAGGDAEKTAAVMLFMIAPAYTSQNLGLAL